MARARLLTRSGDQGSRAARGRACALALDLREIRYPMDSVPETGEQVQPPSALGGIGIVHRDMIEKGVDRASKAGERFHRAGEILSLDCSAGLWLGGIERADQRLL